LSAAVVDASVAIKWVVAEKGTTEALALLGGRLVAPALWEAECANILWKKVKRGEISGGEAGIAAKLLSRFGVELAFREPELSAVLELALALDHPPYDCVYLALAEKRGIPLITADERLLRVAMQSGKGTNLRGVTVLPLVPEPAVN
jgi:predicted nucleic acid-binding protein